MLTRWVSAGLVVGCSLGWATVSRAQLGLPAAGGGSTASPAAMMANPYLNPYLNPYVNPVATQQPMSGRNAALYLYMANSANGGIGSGQISQTRPAPGMVAQQQAAQANGRAVNPALANTPKSGSFGRTQVRGPAEMPDTAQVPGSGAAKFFNPNPGNANGVAKYYARRNTYFNSNGH